ncbi:MAG: PilN domain-containing protein [Sedimentisphaerales bacterium]|nr:PilN domain-containing protein [Sedimentisphaerales bacterium]
MKEIDFLPSWYNNARRRRLRYRMQYAFIVCIFAAMVGWSFFIAKLLSTAQAAVGQMPPSHEQNRMLQECAQIQMKLSSLTRQADTVKKIEPKIAVAAVLAELSFLADSKILFTQVDMQAEGFDGNGQTGTDGSDMVRVARNPSGSTVPLIGEVRCKVTIQGIACEAGDVARLICNLEGSPYFCQVIPGFSRTSQIKTRQASEFGISCYIANYREAKQ